MSEPSKQPICHRSRNRVSVSEFRHSEALQSLAQHPRSPARNTPKRSFSSENCRKRITKFHPLEDPELLCLDAGERHDGWRLTGKFCLWSSKKEKLDCLGELIYRGGHCSASSFRLCARLSPRSTAQNSSPILKITRLCDNNRGFRGEGIGR